MIELKNISKDFGSGEKAVHAVRDVSLSIGSGEIFGIIGFSGAGKSTLVRCINLLERPSSGSVFVAGQDLTALSAKDLRAARKKIGMIFQHFNLMPSRTVAGNVAYPLQGQRPEQGGYRRRRSQRCSELVGIGDKADAYPSQLSGGQKQRVAIARALANDPTGASVRRGDLRARPADNEGDPAPAASTSTKRSASRSCSSRTRWPSSRRSVTASPSWNTAASSSRARSSRSSLTPSRTSRSSFIHTTSNLQKVEELIAEDSPVTRLQPGELIVRLSYVQRNVNEPLISAVSQMFDVSLNIIFADITIVQDSPIGGTVAIISGERKQITKAIEYLIEKNVGVEVIKDARADR